MSILKEKLERIMNQRVTLLGTGPMSRQCIDATIEIAGEYNIPLMMIASRRQIDGEFFGGGYVNDWTTAEFCEYVHQKDKFGNIILCRDHGGPWQNNFEKEQKLGLHEAMQSAKRSFAEDIESGMQIIHIDPSIDIFRNPEPEEIVDRVLELYEYCWERALCQNASIEFEIGTEEQSGSTGSTITFQNSIRRINRHCDRFHMPRPLFAVVQNGTKVMETENVGSYDLPLRVEDEIPPEIQIPVMSRICRSNGVYMKAHNTDYLSDESLQWYPRLGIHAANVAPEFGVEQTKAMKHILINNGLKELWDQMEALAVTSKKWEKWMRPDSKADNSKKAIICVHYLLCEENFKELVKQAEACLLEKGIDLNQYLIDQIKSSILRYLKNFRMVR